jgi:hypothetical protein
MKVIIPARKDSVLPRALLGLACALVSAGGLVSCGESKDVERGLGETPVAERDEGSAGKKPFDTKRVDLTTDFTPTSNAGKVARDEAGKRKGSGSTQAGGQSSVTSVATSEEGGFDPREVERPEGSTSPVVAAAPLVLDKDFCKGLPHGSCFTLVIQIPSPMLAQSLGLSVINVGQFSPNYRGILSRTCNEGLDVGWRHLLSDQGVGPVHKQGTLRKAFPHVKRVRCVLQNVTTEEAPPPSLARNEHGISIRMVDFGLESKSSSTSPAFGKFEFKQARMVFKFRDPYAYVRGAKGAKEWRPVAGYDLFNVARQTGVFPAATKRVNFSDNMTFDFNMQGSARYVHHVLMPVIDSASKGEGLGKLGLQLAVMRNQLALIAAGSNPVVPALILAGIGIDAVRDLCAFEESDCRIRNSTENVGGVIARTYASRSPIPSETKATFVDGTKYIPFAIMSAVVEGMDKKAFLAMTKP